MTAGLLALAAGVGALYLGAELLVRGAASLSKRFGVNPLVVGVIVIAYGTSMPELAVSVEAAIKGSADIAVSNIVGSNICTIGVVLGLAVLVRPMRVQLQMLRWHVPTMIGSLLFLSITLIDGRLTRWEGGLLFAGIVGYTVANLWAVKKEQSQAVRLEFEGVAGVAHRRVWLDLFLVLAGLGSLFVGGNILIDGATEVALALGVSEALIGLTVVAVGTSVPDVMASTVAALKGQGDMAIGNAIGSVVFNSLNALGVAALIEPMAGFEIRLFDLGVMAGLAVLTFPLMRSGFELRRWEGAVLIFIYGGYVALRWCGV